MYAEQVEKSEKTTRGSIWKNPRGSIIENHVYIGRSTWVAGQASIRARINSSEKEKYKDNSGSRAVEKNLLGQNFILLEKWHRRNDFYKTDSI